MSRLATTACRGCCEAVIRPSRRPRSPGAAILLGRIATQDSNHSSVREGVDAWNAAYLRRSPALPSMTAGRLDGGPRSRSFRDRVPPGLVCDESARTLLALLNCKGWRSHRVSGRSSPGSHTVSGSGAIGPDGAGASPRRRRQRRRIC